MIINIYNEDDPKPKQFKFDQINAKVILGRNPKCQNSQQTIVVEHANASRTHLSIRIKNNTLQIKDLNSSNGTQVNSKSIEPDTWVNLQFGDEIVLGGSFGKIVVLQKNKRETNSRQKSSSSSSSSSSRSREKRKKAQDFIQLCKQLKISQSSLKMLKQMTSEKKSKDEKIKFLKLMGCRNVQAHWDTIEQQLKNQNKYTNNNKKAAEQLQKQFDSGRATFEKKGLGSK